MKEADNLEVSPQDEVLEKIKSLIRSLDSKSLLLKLKESHSFEKLILSVAGLRRMCEEEEHRLKAHKKRSNRNKEDVKVKNKEELKPWFCPFCLEKKAKCEMEHKLNERYYVICYHCLANGPVRNSKSKAIEAWNERH